MILKLMYGRAGSPVDIEASVEADATVGELAEHLARRDPRGARDVGASVTLSVGRGPERRVLDPGVRLAGSAVVSGAEVDVVPVETVPGLQRPEPSAAVVEVVEGPDAGARVPLQRGTNYIGRGPEADVRLRDDTVSKSHAKINVADEIEIIDNNSSNGVVIGGVQVARAVVLPDDLIELGDTSIRVRLTSTERRGPMAGDLAGPVDPRFVRPPRISPVFAPVEIEAPEIPGVPEPQRLSVVALITPLLVGAGLYAVTRQVASLVFVLMSPMMVVGQWVESKLSRRRSVRRAAAAFEAELVLLGDRVRALQAEEVARRGAEAPTAGDGGEAIRQRSDLLWCRQPRDDQFLVLRLGLGRARSRVSIEKATSGSRNLRLEDRLREFVGSMASIDRAPILADLRTTAVGVGGPRDLGAAVVRSLIMQVAALHAPQDVTIAACMSSIEADTWDWLKWLPHASSPASPLTVPGIAAGPGGVGQLLTSLEEVVQDRQAVGTAADQAFSGNHVVLLVTDDAPVDRGRLVSLAASGAEVGVHVLWLAAERGRLPAACRVFVALDSDAATAGFVEAAEQIQPLDPERLDLGEAQAWARLLSPVVDAGSSMQDESDLPRAVSFLSLADSDLGSVPAAVAERWRESDSLARHRKPGSRRKAGTLRALIGQSANGPLTLDLRADGPHALVGGTTGSGKSELLQTWVLALAAAHSPERVTFLFVDYKGGSAFGECVTLPHSVGLVTDLSPHLVHRALDSLEAEVRHRERILNKARAKDLIEMEKAGNPETPPSLVIIVDEFAALVHEVPEFVDGVVNIAQRGRSLGLHLILATQRPAGVIKDNLRANTNLRLALRMADEENSSDVLGTPDAADFDPTAPGRAAVRKGPKRIENFQAAYVGGYTKQGGPERQVLVRDLSLVAPQPWTTDPDAADFESDPGPTDLQRTLRTIRAAALLEDVAPPRRPWLPELPAVIELRDLPTRFDDAEVVFARQDQPENQDQPTCSFRPDVDGNLAIFGVGGSGKSAALRTLAISAGLSAAPVHVYGLDFGARGLKMLEPLPHVGAVIPGEDAERVARLLRMLREFVNERAERFASMAASSIVDYRKDAARPGEPRILLLLDGLAAFRHSHDQGGPSGLFEVLMAIASDGRQVGVHVVITADRPGTVPSALNSLIPRRLALRLADDNDLATLGVPGGLFNPASPPGRGYFDGHEVQVAVLGGSASSPAQAGAISGLGAALARNPSWPPAPGVRRLPEDLLLDELPPTVGARPVLGMADEDLAPATFIPEGTFAIVGPPGSGRTTALTTVVRSAVEALPGARVAVFTPARRLAAMLGGLPSAVVATGHEAVSEVATELAAALRDAAGDPWIIAVENPAEFLNGVADLPLQDLVKAARNGGHFVVAEGETQSMAGSWPLLQALRFSRRGLALQPDQTDGELVFRTAFPRVRRSDFVQGRGLQVGEGRSRKVQVARSPGGG